MKKKPSSRQKPKAGQPQNVAAQPERKGVKKAKASAAKSSSKKHSSSVKKSTSEPKAGHKKLPKSAPNVKAAAPKKTSAVKADSKKQVDLPKQDGRKTTANSKPKQVADSNLKAKTVKTAFKKFQTKIVDLERATTKRGLASRSYLFKQIKGLATKYSDFPKLKGGYISFGSFARRTKTRPLDDIDLMALLDGKGIRVEMSYRQKASGYGVNMTPVCHVILTDPLSPLQSFVDDKGFINSIKILNRIKAHLAHIDRYKKAEKNRRMQAVTLKLKTLPWNFDIVPAIPVHDYQNKVTHFLIPDGQGNWIRTNPKIDAKSLTVVNTKHKGELLPVLRMLKYWNGRQHKPKLLSYYFETLVVQTFQYAPTITSYPAAIAYFFQHCPNYLMSSCPDPKQLGEALDVDVSWEKKQKVIKAMRSTADHTRRAMMAESVNDQKAAIFWWRKVFGTDFPAYG